MNIYSCSVIYSIDICTELAEALDLLNVQAVFTYNFFQKINGTGIACVFIGFVSTLCEVH